MEFEIISLRSFKIIYLSAVWSKFISDSCHFSWQCHERSETETSDKYPSTLLPDIESTIPPNEIGDPATVLKGRGAFVLHEQSWRKT